MFGCNVGRSNCYVVASEASCFELIDAKFVRDIEPGEMVIVDRRGLRTSHPFASARPRHCVFEFAHFSRPDSVIDGVSVYEARKNLGRSLADEHPVEADVVIAVPDSGVPATIGFAERARLPFEVGLVRSHYVGRTFIEPQQSIRHFGVKLKLAPVAAVLNGKRVVVVDDSIVRGTTSRKIVKMLRAAGAREVHMRISSPPNQWPCYYGIDTPTRSELIASSHDLAEINQYITSDSLAYLSLKGMIDAVVKTGGGNNGSPERHLPTLREVPSLNRESFCDACWSGRYPIEFCAAPATPANAIAGHVAYRARRDTKARRVSPCRCDIKK